MCIGSKGGQAPEGVFQGGGFSDAPGRGECQSFVLGVWIVVVFAGGEGIDRKGGRL